MDAVDKSPEPSQMKVSVLKFTENRGIFKNGRQPCSQRMSWPWNQELGWSL